MDITIEKPEGPEQPAGLDQRPSHPSGTKPESAPTPRGEVLKQPECNIQAGPKPGRVPVPRHHPEESPGREGVQSRSPRARLEEQPGQAGAAVPNT